MSNLKTKKAAKAAARKRRRSEPTSIQPGQKLLTKAQVLNLIGGLAPSTLWSWMRDDLFPLPLELGPPGARSSTSRWDARDIYEWLATRPRRKLGQHEFRGIEAALPPVAKVKTVRRIPAERTASRATR